MGRVQAGRPSVPLDMRLFILKRGRFQAGHPAWEQALGNAKVQANMGVGLCNEQRA